LKLAETEAGDGDIVGRNNAAFRRKGLGRFRIPREPARAKQDPRQRNAKRSHDHSPARPHLIEASILAAPEVSLAA
jgi:hypothetical protein